MFSQIHGGLQPLSAEYSLWALQPPLMSLPRCSVIAAYIRCHGFTVFPYLNDCFLVTRSCQEACVSTLVMLQLLSFFQCKNWKIHPHSHRDFISASLNSIIARAYLPFLTGVAPNWQSMSTIVTVPTKVIVQVKGKFPPQVCISAPFLASALDRMIITSATLLGWTATWTTIQHKTPGHVKGPGCTSMF